ncbi:MAG: hypothetical protein H0V71_02175 [Chloroflexi bacterium]|nr:hypothetical protein [Chloroflexota bacterium]
MNCPKCGTEFQVVFSGQPSAKVKRVSTMSDEQRKAVGIRLQTARAAKMGLTLDQLRTLKIRPGQKPTAEDLARVKGETSAKAAKPAKKAAKK